jgi:hypothetical protein
VAEGRKGFVMSTETKALETLADLLQKLPHTRKIFVMEDGIFDLYCYPKSSISELHSAIHAETESREEQE